MRNLIKCMYVMFFAGLVLLNTSCEKEEVEKDENERAERMSKFMDDSDGYICTLWMK